MFQGSYNVNLSDTMSTAEKARHLANDKLCFYLHKKGKYLSHINGKADIEYEKP